MNSAKKLLANSMVVNAIMTSDTPQEVLSWPVSCKKTIEYIKKQLQAVPNDIIPQDLYEKISRTQADVLSESQSSQSKVKPGSSASESTAASTGRASAFKRFRKL